MKREGTEIEREIETERERQMKEETGLEICKTDRDRERWGRGVREMWSGVRVVECGATYEQE